MTMKSLLSAGLVSAGLGVGALGLSATTVQAVPAAGLADAFDRNAVGRSGLAETVTWHGRRYCGWDYGYRRCWYGHHNSYRPYHYYGPYYGYGHYRYGNRRWWY